MPLDALVEEVVERGLRDTPADRFVKAETLHELLGLALDDFKQILKTPGYVISIAAWHEGHAKALCAVCMAGASLALRFRPRADLPGADRTQAATLIPHRTQHPPIGGRRIARSLLNCTERCMR
jgi:hypothetical protein